jgi:hypothetical protein
VTNNDYEDFYPQIDDDGHVVWNGEEGQLPATLSLTYDLKEKRYIKITL